MKCFTFSFLFSQSVSELENKHHFFLSVLSIIIYRLAVKLSSSWSRMQDVCDPAPPAEVSTMVGVMEVMEGCSVSTPPGLLAARTRPRPILSRAVWIFCPEIFLLTGLISSLSCQFSENIQPGAGGEWSANTEEWGVRTDPHQLHGQSVSQSSSGFHTVQTSGQSAPAPSVSQAVRQLSALHPTRSLSPTAGAGKILRQVSLEWVTQSAPRCVIPGSGSALLSVSQHQTDR